VSDAQSKVTLRPRSKLERLLDALSGQYEVPDRPALDLLSQLTLLQLVGGGADGKAALCAMSPLCKKNGSVDPKKLAETSRELVASVCREEQVADTLQALRAAGEVAAGAPDGFDAHCQTDLSEARRLLRTLPGITEQRADLLLLYAGVHAVIAPTANGVHVAARLGYPGTSYASFARALDAELPAPDAVEIAWSAHHLLEQHGKKICSPHNPTCGRCPIRAACAFHGEGEDPATKLSARPPA
jgi:endonuclease III